MSPLACSVTCTQHHQSAPGISLPTLGPSLSIPACACSTSAAPAQAAGLPVPIASTHPCTRCKLTFITLAFVCSLANSACRSSRCTCKGPSAQSSRCKRRTYNPHPTRRTCHRTCLPIPSSLHIHLPVSPVPALSAPHPWPAQGR